MAAWLAAPAGLAGLGTARHALCARPEPQVRAAVEAVIPPLMTVHGIPGMSVALSLGGSTYHLHYGQAAPAQPAPVTEATLFEIGSISKLFTATLAAYAHALGALSLDDHPGRHLPALRGCPLDYARLWHLGTYTAGGLPLQFPEAVRHDREALAYLRAFRPEAEPGAVRRYSNPSMGLLGAATAAALGDRFDRLMTRRLLPALGMAQAFVHVPPARQGDYAWGLSDGRPVRAQPGPMDAAAYGLKMTATDLLRFLQAQWDPTGLAAPLRTAVQLTQQARVCAGALVQGLGWEQMAYPAPLEGWLQTKTPALMFEAQPARPAPPTAAAGPRLFDKTGSTRGFGAYVVTVPEQRLGLVLLANRNYPIPARVTAAFEIVQALATPAPSPAG